MKIFNSFLQIPINIICLEVNSIFQFPTPIYLNGSLWSPLIPCMMKIYTEFDLATLLRLAMELSTSKFRFLNLNYISYHWKTPKRIIICVEFKFSEFAINEIANFNYQSYLPHLRSIKIMHCFVYHSVTLHCWKALPSVCGFHSSTGACDSFF